MIQNLRGAILQLALKRPAKSKKVHAHGHSLIVRGDTCFDESDSHWLFALMPGVERFLDVGAHVGTSSMLAGIQGVSQIVAIEPCPQSLAYAAENMIFNFPNVRFTCVQGAASNIANEILEFHTASTGAANSLFADHAITASRIGHTIRVQSITLDTLCADLNFEPQLIKIDIEGAEAQALDGLVALLNRCKPRLFVEMHSRPSLSMENNAAHVLRWCQNQGYTAWYLKDHTRLTDAQTIAHRGRCHLLLIDQNDSYPLAALQNALTQNAA